MSPQRLGWIGWGLVIILLLVATWCGQARATEHEPLYTYQSPNGMESGKLYNDPCVADIVLQYIPPEFRDDARKAAGRHGGIEWAACYVILGDMMFFIWEDGGLTRIPVGLLKEPL